jgi:cell wall-associated NlpC family hydrolase
MWCVAGVVAVIVIIAAAAGGIVSAITGGGGAGMSCRATLATGGATPAGLSDEQARNAGVIVAVGQRMGVPVRGWVIAVATALQESDLINSGVATDHDSLGLFQQRPSQGWGTPEQITNPTYAATKFFEHLVRVPGWLTIPVTQAAQVVQNSAYPDAYAKHEARAAMIVAAYTGGVVCDGGAGASGADSVALPPGFTLPPDTPTPVVVAIRWALAQVDTPYTFGGDCTDPHGGNPAHQCDCSSLMQQAYRIAGIRIPGHHDQVHAGTPVAGVTGVRPGDLIFIPGSDGTASNPGHVGMAIGSGLLVQAPGTGDTVKISTLASWSPVAIRRIVSN